MGVTLGMDFSNMSDFQIIIEHLKVICVLLGLLIIVEIIKK